MERAEKRELLKSDHRLDLLDEELLEELREEMREELLDEDREAELEVLLVQERETKLEEEGLRVLLQELAEREAALRGHQRAALRLELQQLSEEYALEIQEKGRIALTITEHSVIRVDLGNTSPAVQTASFELWARLRPIISDINRVLLEGGEA